MGKRTGGIGGGTPPAADAASQPPRGVATASGGSAPRTPAPPRGQGSARSARHAHSPAGESGRWARRRNKGMRSPRREAEVERSPAGGGGGVVPVPGRGGWGRERPALREGAGSQCVCAESEQPWVEPPAPLGWGCLLKSTPLIAIVSFPPYFHGLSVL